MVRTRLFVKNYVWIAFLTFETEHLGLFHGYKRKHSRTMITKEVIKDIYKEYRKPIENIEDLRIPYFLRMLEPHHNLKFDGDELIFEDMEDFNPFRRILVRNLHVILEFNKMVAFVFPNHILFLGKRSPELSVHFKPEEEDVEKPKKKSIFSRLFSKDDKDE